MNNGMKRDSMTLNVFYELGRFGLAMDHAYRIIETQAKIPMFYN
jgi:hypothetical protein